MKHEPDTLVISTLQMEYNAVRQEIRDLINSMDTNLNIGISMIGGSAALAASFKRTEILYMIPSVIFFATCIHLIKTCSCNVHGAYCQAIEARLKSFLGPDKVLLDWEGGEIFQHLAGPTGVVQIGIYIFFAGVIVIFVSVATFSYQWQGWTAYVHASQFVVLVGYAVRAVMWNTPLRREGIVKHYQRAATESSARNVVPPAARQ